MFENQKIYITELKTVTLTENRTEQRPPANHSITFGLAPSVYGKMINCYYGGNYLYRSYAITQPEKQRLISNCYYKKGLDSVETEGVECIDQSNVHTLLNSGIETAKKLYEIKDIPLNSWKLCNGTPMLSEDSTVQTGKKGSGTKSDPYIIATQDDFISFTNNINNGNTFEGKYFHQVRNIDLSNRTDYIGTNGSRRPYNFKGIYNGCGHTINIALDTTGKKCNNTVFPYTNGIIANLGITGSIASDGKYISGFVRSIQPKGIMVNCYSIVNFITNTSVELNYELRYYISGNSHIKYGQQEFDISGGCVLYVPKIQGVEQVYTEHILSPCTYISIYFNTDFKLTKEMFVCSFNDPMKIKILFEKMHMTWVNKKSMYYLECMSLVYKIVANLSKPTGNYLPKDKYKKIEKGCEYLFENCFNKDIDFYYPAILCEISYTYFKQLFIQKYEMPPKQKVQEMRMERATELLKTSNCTITEIADICGFENVYYFSRAFKKYLGTSPKNYIP